MGAGSTGPATAPVEIKIDPRKTPVSGS